MPYRRGPGLYVRRFDEVPLPEGELANECLGMFESGTFIRSFVPVGLQGPDFHYHPSDQVYFVLEGELTIEIGSSTLTAGEHELVILPREWVHRNYNRGDVDELHLEIFLPSPPPWPTWKSPGELAAEPAPPNLVRGEAEGRRLAYDSNPGYVSHILADRASGFDSGHIRIDRLDPGSSGPGLHIHRFDQFYFVLEGELAVEVAGERQTVTRHQLVVLPAGVPHRQWNESGGQVKWLTMNLPEPEPGVRWDAPVESFAGDFSYKPREKEPI